MHTIITLPLSASPSDTCFCVPSDDWIKLVLNHLLLFSGVALHGEMSKLEDGFGGMMENIDGRYVCMPWVEKLVLQELACRLTGTSNSSHTGSP